MTVSGKALNAEALALPDYAHIPGRNSRHDPAFLHAICELAPAHTTDEAASANIAWNYGIILFNQGFYWECHEVLEKVWMNAAPNSREKHLVQAVIHLANACLKLRMERPSAAARLCRLAMTSLERARLGGDVEMMKNNAPRLMGLCLAELESLALSEIAEGKTVQTTIIYAK